MYCPLQALQNSPALSKTIEALPTSLNDGFFELEICQLRQLPQFRLASLNER
jgi:hypothetical protein